MSQGRNTRSGTSDDEGGDISDLGRLEVSLRSLFETQNQRLVQTLNNNNMNIEQNAKSIFEINDLLVGLSMQVTKLVASKTKGSENTNSITPLDKESPSNEHLNSILPFLPK